ncbi:MAG TPA: GreA/GreB family elongation factor [Patescibacteria group bacterium]|nr:GreA/GreB family elongation factor [Patescibacteria group bacterium]
MALKKNFMLRSTHQKLLSEHAEVERELKQTIPEEIENAYSIGGEWHDNPGYDAALERQSQTARRLGELANLLRTPVFIENLDINGDEIRVGTNVVLSYANGTEISYDILGLADARYRDGTMSCFSPLAQQLMGHKAGEKVKCKLPKGEEEIRVVEVKKIDFSA